MTKSNGFGFTLIELLVVLAITGVLSAIGFSSFQTYQKQQVLIAGVRSLSSDLHAAEEYAVSGNKPTSCVNAANPADPKYILNSYQFKVTSPTTYEIDANCIINNVPTTVVIKTVTMATGLTINAANLNPIIFKTLAQGTNISTGQLANVLVIQGSTGYTHTLSLGENGNIQDIGLSQSATSTPGPTGTGTPTPTPTPTPTGIPTPTPTPTPTSTPLPIPIAWYKFNEGSGSSTSDSSGNGFTGTWNGTLGSQWTTGVVGSAGNFNGSNNYVSVSDGSSLDITGDMSISAWVKPSIIDGTSRVFLEKGDGASARQYGLRLSSGNQWALFIYIGATGYSTADATTVPSTSRWDHVVGVRSGTNILIYTNGILQHTSTGVSGSTTTSTSILTIGRSGAGAFNYYGGGVDDARIYNFALSASQVQYLYTHPEAQ